MRRLLRIVLLLGISMMMGCATSPSAAGGKPGPTIDGIETSTKSFSIDCAPTSVTVTAHVTDASGLGHVRLMYRVGSDGPYTAVEMAGLQTNEYAATVKGEALGTAKYGAWEFYIVAADTSGARTQSQPDSTVQFLPCIH